MAAAQNDGGVRRCCSTPIQAWPITLTATLWSIASWRIAWPTSWSIACTRLGSHLKRLTPFSRFFCGSGVLIAIATIAL